MSKNKNISSNKILKKIKDGLVLATLGGAMLSFQAQADFKVVGYFPSWVGDVNTIQYDKLTHINYSFVLPNNDGSLKSLDGGTARLQQLVQKSHSAGVKVLIAIGGWNDGDDSAFRNLAANSYSRNNFVNNVVNFVNQHNLDGVDIDWEYPDGNEVANFRLLMSQLSQAMHSRGKLLTAAVTSADAPGSVDGSIINNVDFLNIMAYDLGYPHSTYAAAQNAVNHWKYNEGLPKDKTVLGVPFYSHKDWVSYKDVIARYGKYAAQIDNAGGLDYNGQPTIRAKSELALNDAGGIMFWEVSQDTNDETSLMSTIWDVVGNSIKNNGGFTNGSIYKISAKHSGKAIDVSGISSSNGANIHQWSYVGGNNQKWRALDRGNSYFSLQSVHSGKCLDVGAWSNSNGANIQQWDCHGGANQQFKLENQGSGFSYLRARHSNKCVDVSGVSSANGASIHQWDCNGQDNAKWKVEKTN